MWAPPHCKNEAYNSEGIIHFTAELEKLKQVANQFYRESPGSFIIVCIAVERLGVDQRWEMAGDRLLSHIYGGLNRSAVVDVASFPRNASNWFVLPPELRQ